MQRKIATINTKYSLSQPPVRSFAHSEVNSRLSIYASSHKWTGNTIFYFFNRSSSLSL
jgi:hypothetical protein